MPNRYTRDELIKIAMDQVHLPNLEVHDMSDGVVAPDAFSIQWLQDILDFWFHMVPFSATIKATALNCTANSDTILLPADFILDVRNGYLTEQRPGDTSSLRRTLRVPLQRFLNRRLSHQRASNVQYPTVYCIVGDDGIALTQRQTMKVSPIPSIDTAGELWYYALPAVLEAHTKPKMPNDYVCIEYLKIRMLEWAHLFEPGTAQKFCEKLIGGMKAAGLMNEPEDDEIPMDSAVYHKQSNGLYHNTYAWMGPQ